MFQVQGGGAVATAAAATITTIYNSMYSGAQRRSTFRAIEQKDLSYADLQREESRLYWAWKRQLKVKKFVDDNSRFDTNLDKRAGIIWDISVWSGYQIR